MSNLLRRLPPSRLLLLCGLVIALGASATAIALAVGNGPTPPPKGLANAVHDALSAPAVEGVSASVQLTDHLLEGANLTSGGSGSGFSSSPLVTGASGRLWIAKDGRVRLELQSEKGDTQIYYDGQHTVSMYDASSNTLYRYVIPAHEGASGDSSSSGSTAAPDGNSASTQTRGASEAVASARDHQIPTVAKIEEAISHVSKHANVSGATPTDVAGQAAYTVRVSPNESGSLLGGAELSWDAVHGAPLRAAIYSSTSSSPALELAATSISYGPVESSVFEFTPPANAKVEEVVLPHEHSAAPASTQSGEHPHVTSQGHGITSIGIIESKATTSTGQSSQTTLPEGLQKVKINGVEATELPTELGTLLSFESSGVRYLLAGAVGPAALEAVAKGL